MKITVRTHLTKQGRYRIVIFRDGVQAGTVIATAGSVTKKRNQILDYWSSQSDVESVEAPDSIPYPMELKRRENLRQLIQQAQKEEMPV